MSREIHIKDFMLQFRERLPELLTPAQLRIVELRLVGKNNAEIAVESGISESAVKGRMLLARARIEEELIYPAGIKRLTDYKDKSLIHAAGKGRVEAVKFLEMWYSTDEGVGGYKPKVLIKTPVRESVLYDTASLKNMPEGDSPEVFRQWFFTTAKVVSDQRLSWHRRRTLAQPDDLERATEIFREQFGEWLERKNIILSPAQIRVFKLKLIGKENIGISRKTGWSRNSIENHIKMARDIIEEDLLYPSGIKRVSSYSSVARNAGLRGQLDAVWFAGQWYTTDDRVLQYRSR